MTPSSSNPLAEGRRLHQAGQWADARRLYLQVLQQEPQNADALALLGILDSQAGRHDSGIGSLRRAVELAPGRASLQNNLGVALLAAGRADEATVAFRQAVLARPDYGEAWKNLTVALVDSGRFDDAKAAGQLAAQHSESDPDAFYNLGVAHWENGEIEAAHRCYEQALRLDENHAKSRWSNALYRLITGDWERGWAEYEWRWSLPGQVRPRCRAACWEGQPLDDRTLLVFAEQGLGDSLQFVRLLAEVKRRHRARILFAAPHALVPLLRSVEAIDELVRAGDEHPPCDLHAPLLSLPALLGIRPDTAGRDVPYLSAEPSRAARLGEWLSSIPRPWVGIAWQGRPGTRVDRERSAPLAALKPLAAATGSPLICLQKGPGLEQLDGIHFAVARPGPGFDEPEPFMDTAALMVQLDLVVTTDSAVAHLAGALGVPTWIALPRMPEWRWRLDRPDSPWYPSARLFRQTTRGDWSGVFRQMAGAWCDARPKAPG